MKFDKKDSKLFNKTKKFVYVSAIAGVLLTGAQASQFSSTYTANADAVTAGNNKVTISFVDQDNNQLGGVLYDVQANSTISKSDLISWIHSNHPNYNTDNNNILDSIDGSKADSYTFTLTQPTHTLHAEIVDQNNNKIFEKDYTVTDYGQFLGDLVTHVPNNYGYSTKGLNQSTTQTSFTLPVTAPTTTIVDQNNQSQQPTQTATASDSQSASETSQPATSTDAKTETTTTESSKPDEQTSPVSQTTKTDATTTATQSPVKTTTTTTPSVTEAVSKPVDPVSKGEAKKTVAKQAPATKNKDVRAKLPQTGDNTNQTRAIALGVATIALGLGLAYFGLRRKNK